MWASKSLGSPTFQLCLLLSTWLLTRSDFHASCSFTGWALHVSSSLAWSVSFSFGSTAPQLPILGNFPGQQCTVTSWPSRLPLKCGWKPVWLNYFPLHSWKLSIRWKMAVFATSPSCTRAYWNHRSRLCVSSWQKRKVNPRKTIPWADKAWQGALLPRFWLGVWNICSPKSLNLWWVPWFCTFGRCPEAPSYSPNANCRLYFLSLLA